MCSLFTDCVANTRKGDVFSHVCPFVQMESASSDTVRTYISHEAWRGKDNERIVHLLGRVLLRSCARVFV